jgi:hypothetical protein
MIDTSSAQTQLLTLAPARVAVSNDLRFRDVQASGRRYEEMLAKLQRFRGRVYLQDGAISPNELTSDGRHRMDIDERSWHVLAVDKAGEVCGCVRYLPEHRSTDFADLWIREAAITRCPTWGDHFRRAVEQERARARGKNVAFAAVGGWAVAEDRRWTTDPLRMILGVWGLSRLLGGCVGVATATVRHGSAVILRRIGLRSLMANGVEVPSYYDPHYGCEMEALRFDSDLPNPKYRTWIEELREQLEFSPVICKITRTAEWAVPARTLETPKLPLPFPLTIAGQLAR